MNFIPRPHSRDNDMCGAAPPCKEYTACSRLCVCLNNGTIFASLGFGFSVGNRWRDSGHLR